MHYENKPLTPRDFEEIGERMRVENSTLRALQLQLGDSELAKEANELIQRKIDFEDEVKVATDEKRKAHLQEELAKIRRRILDILSKE